MGVDWILTLPPLYQGIVLVHMALGLVLWWWVHCMTVRLSDSLAMRVCSRTVFLLLFAATAYIAFLVISALRTL